MFRKQRKRALIPCFTKVIILSTKSKNPVHKIILKSGYEFHLNQGFKNSALKRKAKLVITKRI